MKALGKLLFLSSILWSGISIAGSGKAIVPYWDIAPNGQQTNIYISNITGHDLEVKVTFYTLDGSEYTGPTIHYKNFDNGNTVIAARKSAFIYVSNPPNGTPYQYGHAIIEWHNQGNDNDTVGLVAHGWKADPAGRAAIPINMGSPF